MKGWSCPIFLLITTKLLTSPYSVEEDEIDAQCDKLRADLLEKMERGGGKGDAPRKELKNYQVHEMADAKIKESERLRNALKISKDYEEGSHWRRQEERLRKALERDGDKDTKGS
jgi:hypothetical protein